MILEHKRVGRQVQHIGRTGQRLDGGLGGAATDEQARALRPPPLVPEPRDARHLLRRVWQRVEAERLKTRGARVGLAFPAAVPTRDGRARTLGPARDVEVRCAKRHQPPRRRPINVERRQVALGRQIVQDPVALQEEPAGQGRERREADQMQRAGGNDEHAAGRSQRIHHGVPDRLAEADADRHQP